MEKLRLISFLLFFAAVSPAYCMQFDAEIDSQYYSRNFSQNEIKFEKFGFSLKEIFPDDEGDRLICFFRLESENNFSGTFIDQAYAQYKGPLGKWNIALGRFILPFGLLTSFDTEWLLVKTQEYRTISIKNDSGAKLFGTLDDFQYALSITQGVGTEKWLDIDSDKIISLRLGYEGTDFEDLKFGVSFLIGNVAISGNNVYKKLVALDMTKYIDQITARFEICSGQENGQNLYSTFTEAEFRVLPLLDLNLAHNFFSSNNYYHSITMGVSYNTPVYGFIARAAYKNTFGGESKNEIFIQIYKLFTGFF